MSIRDKKKDGAKNRRREMSVAIFSALLRRGSTTTQTKILKVRGKGQDYTYFRSFLPNLKVVVKMLLQTLNDYLFGISRLGTCDPYFKQLSLVAS